MTPLYIYSQLSCSGNLGHGVADWTCEACQRQPQMVNITVVSSKEWKDANGFVAFDPLQSSIVVSFAGTDPLSIIDWIDDLKFDKVPYPPCATSNCAVHEGFYQTYQAIAPSVLAAVHALMVYYGEVGLQFTGHSLGAALAVHGTIDFYVRGFHPILTYAFGQPRVGNTEFSDFYNNAVNTHFRITHHKDPVPHLPPQSFGFEHILAEIFYPQAGNHSNYTICHGDEDVTCSDQYALDVDVNDHLNYLGVKMVDQYLKCKL